MMMTSFMVLIITFVMLSNSMLILGLCKSSANLSLPGKMFIILSCNDMLSGFSFLLIGWFIATSCRAIHIMASIAYFFIIYGVAIFLTLSALRFISLKKPLTRIRNFHVYVTLVVELLVAGGVGILCYITLTNSGTKSLPIIQFTLLVFFFSSIVLVTLLNLLSYKALHANSMKSNGSAGAGNPNEIETSVDVSQSDQLRNKRKHEAVITLLLISVSYFVFNLPLSIFYVYIALKPIKHEEMMDVVQYVKSLEILNFLQFLALATAGTNAVIYIARSKEMKSFCKSFIVTTFHAIIRTTKPSNI